MDITKLSRLFSTDFGQTRKQTEQPRPESRDVQRRNDDAVTLSDRFTLASERPASAVSRAERVESIRKQVREGTYQQPDSQALAEAVSRELFVV